MKQEDRLSYQIKMLKKSESDYFSKGAVNENIEYGVLSKDEEFKTLPAGFVFHNVQESKKIDLLKLEEIFKKEKSNFFRVYLPFSYEESLKNLDEKIKKSYEIGLVKEIDFEEENFFSNTYLEAVQNEDAWNKKRALYDLGSKAPDGHSLSNGSYCSFERKKCDVKYMKTYLYFVDKEAIGTVSISINEDFARLKNLYLIPSFRGKGYAKDMVLNVINQAKKDGAKYLGVYAIEDSKAHEVYKSCGMIDVLKQIELYKEF